MKKVSHKTTSGIVVTLEQVAHHNDHGTVYVLSNDANLGNRWGYGRGDSSCIDSFNSPAEFAKLAETYAALECAKKGA